MDSILTSIKKQLGIQEDYEHFDPDIIMCINTAFMTLTQLGVGPKGGFIITDDSATWSDFIPEESNLEGVKTYIYLKAKLMFDTPSASVLEAMKSMITELEWRINAEVESAES